MGGLDVKTHLDLEKQNMDKILQLCPQMQDRSGIYFFYRMDENGKVIARYIGKSETSILRRCASHLQGVKQHLDLSIKSHGLYSVDNPTGWRVMALEYCEPNICNERERKHIQYCKKLFVDLYNVESGGTAGKVDINERKPSRGYKKGVEYGMHKLSKELQKPLKYVTIAPKDDKKLTLRMYGKFMELVSVASDEGKGDDTNGKNETD